jgi:hypothetical protein
MAIRRMKSRATLRALAAGLAILILAPCWQAAEASAVAVHASHGREAFPPALAEIDPLSEQRPVPPHLQAVHAALACLTPVPALVATGRARADSRALARPPVDAPSRVLRGPPLA